MFQGALNITIVILTYAGIALNGKLAGLGYTSTNLLQQTAYVDLKPCADTYEASFLAQSLAMCVLIVRLTTVFAKNSRVYLIITTFESAGMKILSFFVIYLPIMMAFSLIGMYIWGTYWGDYSNFFKSLITTFMFAVGQVDMDIIQDSHVNSITVIVYLVLFYFFVISFFSIVFKGILIEGYRVVMLDYGHNFHNRTWDRLDYVRWTFAWIPAKVVIKAEEKYKRYKKKLLNAKKALMNE